LLGEISSAVHFRCIFFRLLLQNVRIPLSASILFSGCRLAGKSAIGEAKGKKSMGMLRKLRHRVVILPQRSFSIFPDQSRIGLVGG